MSTVLFTMKIFYQGNLYTMKSTYSILTGTQVLLVADKQHGVVRALSSMFDRWVFVTRRSPNMGSYWQRSYAIKQTKVAIPCHMIKLKTSVYKLVTSVIKN